MQGMGDNIHQRALVRLLMPQFKVFLQTPWPVIYHDLRGDRLQLAPAATRLRTQQKNVQRERQQFDLAALPADVYQLPIGYDGDGVRAYGSILHAMLMRVNLNPAIADFRLPVRPEWHTALEQRLPPIDRPVLVYRPLIMRTEWSGCAQRNADARAYAQILQAVRDQFFLISVADLVPKVEWISSEPVTADLEFHRGELTFELLAALFQRAALVYASAGFAPLLAQAVGTHSITVFGGRESSRTIQGGAHLAPTLGIDPIHPCDCFNPNHACDKTIDVNEATARATSFAASAIAAYDTRATNREQDRVRSACDRLDTISEAVHEPIRAGGADCAAAQSAAT